MPKRSLGLKKDTLARLDGADLRRVAGAGVQTLQSGCQSGVRACWELTDACFTHHSSIDCFTDELCN